MQIDLAEEGRKLYTLFANMKAAYDMVDRGQMVRTLRSKEVKRQIVQAVEDIYENMESVVRVNEKIWQGF